MTTGRINQVATLHGTRARDEHLPPEERKRHRHTRTPRAERGTEAPQTGGKVFLNVLVYRLLDQGKLQTKHPCPKAFRSQPLRLELPAMSQGTRGQSQSASPKDACRRDVKANECRDNAVNKRTKQTRTRAPPPPGHAVAWATEPACPSKGASCPERTHSNLCRHTTSHRVSGQTRIIARRTLRNARRPRTLAAPVSNTGDKGSREHVALIRATRARRLGAPQGHTEDSEPTSHGGRSSGYLAPDMPPLRRKGTLRTTV